MKKTTIVSVKKDKLNKKGIKDFAAWNKRKNTLYIGRNMSHYIPGAVGSIWANKFSIKKYGREQCIELYEEYIRNTLELYDRLEELEGKELGCWCKPEGCHGDVLIKLLEEQKSKE